MMSVSPTKLTPPYVPVKIPKPYRHPKTPKPPPAKSFGAIYRTTLTADQRAAVQALAIIAGGFWEADQGKSLDDLVRLQHVDWSTRESLGAETLRRLEKRAATGRRVQHVCDLGRTLGLVARDAKTGDYAFTAYGLAVFKYLAYY